MAATRRPKLLVALALAAIGLAGKPAASASSGDFDYFILALSWTPSWCEAEGDARGAAVCDAGADRGFVVHGLWPQRERGWPEFCPTDRRPPTRRETAAMADIMGGSGLAWWQWRKHGVCSGLDAPDYFALTREAFARVALPETPVGRVSPRAVEESFLTANPGFVADGVTVTCRDGLLREVRLCFDRALEPRACAPDAARDCRARNVRKPAIR
ncbi:MAG: ribonuclease T [Rhodobacteraceae bacterium]|nr:MAG: ribonuclease T [Paracoccaceae bacterium]